MSRKRYYLIASRHNTDRQINTFLSIHQILSNTQRSTTLNTVKSCYQYLPKFSPLVTFQTPPVMKTILKLIRNMMNTWYQRKKFHYKPPETTHILYNHSFNQIQVVEGLWHRTFFHYSVPCVGASHWISTCQMASNMSHGIYKNSRKLPFLNEIEPLLSCPQRPLTGQHTVTHNPSIIFNAHIDIISHRPLTP